MQACLPGFRYAYDLGEEWHHWTGLPFVFAVWAVRPGVDSRRRRRAAGRQSGGAGQRRGDRRRRAHAARARRRLLPALPRNGHPLRPGPAEMAGLTRFCELAGELDLAPPPQPLGSIDADFERGLIDDLWRAILDKAVPGERLTLRRRRRAVRVQRPGTTRPGRRRRHPPAAPGAVSAPTTSTATSTTPTSAPPSATSAPSTASPATPTPTCCRAKSCTRRSTRRSPSAATRS